MKIAVYFRDWNEEQLCHVANVTVPDDIIHIEDGLEYAWRWTNNVDGSWSIKDQYLDGGYRNGDYNDNVEVVAPLVDGYGHRSSMVGDRYVVNGLVAYQVAGCGFKRIED